uniref:Metallo-beta-lactamase domain-containing protein 1 n=2 Tax=Timema TaxID=61471 RepID=A0A7R9CL15_TIMPO|nr:unnamed protein product [Timema douglasi]CAD7396707.1 unnamed protein product [Timema poppensis]
MTAWDRDRVVEGLTREGLTCDNVDFVVSTHGHSDHIGNNNLFLKAKHIVGFSVSFQDQYFIHPFETSEPYIIDDGVVVIPTPGHTLDHVSVLVRTSDLGTVVVAGDLFEKVEDLEDPSLWRLVAGSDNQEEQEKNRNKILLLADWIVPGHGPIFKVTENMKSNARQGLK